MINKRRRPLSIIYKKIVFCRTLAHGDKKAGFSIFWADDGLDTGPILLQKTTYVDRNDTVDSLYNRFMYPVGIQAMVSDRFTVMLCFKLCRTRLRYTGHGEYCLKRM